MWEITKREFLWLTTFEGDACCIAKFGNLLGKINKGTAERMQIFNLSWGLFYV